MRAMVLQHANQPLVLENRDDPVPGEGEALVRVEACGVCRTDLHVVDGELPDLKLPRVPGHEVVGIIEAVGRNVDGSWLGRRVGVPWLGRTCGVCPYCQAQAENLCDTPEFTGYTRDGGFATHLLVDIDFAVELPADGDPVALAPLLCAGLIGWRCLKKAGDGKRLGIYGFGAAAHIIAQICTWQGREVYAFTSPGDEVAQQFARDIGAVWAGSSLAPPPRQLDAAIIFAPVGPLVPKALAAVRKGGRVVCGGIYMSDIPSMPYRILWEEREILSVANLTRADAREFFPIAGKAEVVTHTRRYPLEAANEALTDLREGRFSGAAVLVP